MIELSNTSEQVIPVGGAVTFDVVLLKSGCDVCYNNILPTSVKLMRPTIYDIEFQGNMTSDTAANDLQMSIAIAGQSIAQTVMDGTPAAAGDLINIGAGTYVRACCDLDRISVINSGTNPVTLAANSLLRVFSVRN